MAPEPHFGAAFSATARCGDHMLTWNQNPGIGDKSRTETLKRAVGFYVKNPEHHRTKKAPAEAGLSLRRTYRALVEMKRPKGREPVARGRP